MNAPAAPRVLVLLAACNGARWITEQLHSILAQRHVDVQVVVRDDRSRDDTPALLAAAATDRRVRLTLPEAASGSAAQNFFSLIRGNPAESFDYVAFSDQDDLWDPHKLHQGAQVLGRGDCAGYSCATTAFWPDGRRVLLRQNPKSTRGDFLFEGAGQGCTFMLSAALYSRFRELAMRQPALTANLHYHDWAIYAASRAWGMKWHFDPRSFVEYRQHAGNDTGARGTYGSLSKRLSLIRTGWYRAQLGHVAALCHQAAPGSALVERWRQLLARPDGWSRRLQVARFCLMNGRRRSSDNAVLLLAALAGWI